MDLNSDFLEVGWIHRAEVEKICFWKDDSWHIAYVERDGDKYRLINIIDSKDSHDFIDIDLLDVEGPYLRYAKENGLKIKLGSGLRR